MSAFAGRDSRFAGRARPPRLNTPPKTPPFPAWKSSGSSTPSQGFHPEQRAVLVLRDIQGLSGAATARELGLSRAAMKSRLHRGREQVRLGLSAPREDTAGREDSADA